MKHKEIVTIKEGKYWLRWEFQDGKLVERELSEELAEDWSREGTVWLQKALGKMLEVTEGFYK